MKTSKKILMIVTSFTITALISSALAGGLSLAGISFWPLFWMFNALQIVLPQIWERYYETKNIIEQLKDYNSKPFKKYEMPLNCAHCGSKNDIEIDLTETEFRCGNCKKINGVHINFMTAAITEPINVE